LPRHRLAFAAALALLQGCAPEERIVSIRGIGHNSPGAQAGWKKELEASEPQGPDLKPVETLAVPEVDAEGKPKNPLRAEDEEGHITLVLRSPRDVVIHLRDTLLADERDLLFEQVLSDHAKAQYELRGLDPRQAVDFLFKNKRDVLRLLSRAPMGEQTPGLFLRKVGGGVYRLEVAPNDRTLKLRKLDFVWESGKCRLALIS
jgi:hypothetical protein